MEKHSNKILLALAVAWVIGISSLNLYYRNLPLRIGSDIPTVEQPLSIHFGEVVKYVSVEHKANRELTQQVFTYTWILVVFAVISFQIKEIIWPKKKKKKSKSPQ